MNRIAIRLSVCICLITPFAPARAAEPDPEIPPVPLQEFRAAWVATVHNIDWPSGPGLPANAQKRELLAILDSAVRNRLNAIIFQVRPASDAMYKSDIEPWSPFLTGKMGRPPSDDFDPLEFAVTAAHARGLELHAWFNPFRALASQSYAASDNHITKTNPELVRNYGKLVWLDPGEPAVRQRALGVIQDVVHRYDVDGVHIDDYFYPYPTKKDGVADPFPDQKTYARYKENGGDKELNDWRRENVDRFVQSVYEMVKAERRTVKFGISPFGIWRPGVPETIVAQLDAYDELFADSRRWLQEGWCDYFSPQLYWRIEPPDQSFPVLLKWWHDQNTGAVPRHVWPGIATDRVNGIDRRNAYNIYRQIGLTRDQAKAESRPPGHVHWNMKAVKTDRGGVATLLRKEAYAELALVPACPWLEEESKLDPAAEDSAPLLSPRITVTPSKDPGNEGGFEVRWEVAGGGWAPAPPRWWLIQLRIAGVPERGKSPWYTAKLTPAATGGHFDLPESGRFDRVAIRPVSAAGSIGEATVSPLQ